MYIFLHISKTGGSTLRDLLYWNFEDTSYTITRYSDVDAFIRLSDEEKRRYKLVQGMVFYGLHEHIPEPCSYFTIVRHPIRRLVSHYYHLNVRKGRLGQPLSDISLEDWIAAEPYIPTMQLRLIAGGRDADEVVRGPLRPDALEIAKRNIEEHFVTVGLTGYFDESVTLLKHRLGLKRAYYARKNVNERRPKFEQLPESTRRFLEEVCAPEMELYKYVRARLDAELAAQDDAFREEVQQLRKSNSRFNTLYTVIKPLRGTALWQPMRRIGRRILG